LSIELKYSVGIYPTEDVFSCFYSFFDNFCSKRAERRTSEGKRGEGFFEVETREGIGTKGTPLIPLNPLPLIQKGVQWMIEGYN